MFPIVELLNSPWTDGVFTFRIVRIVRLEFINLVWTKLCSITILKSVLYGEIIWGVCMLYYKMNYRNKLNVFCMMVPTLFYQSRQTFGVQ